MRFGLLGPVLVEGDGSPIEITSAMARAVLAVLLLNANTVVPESQLIGALWGETPPASATASLRNHLMRLRRQLGEEGGARIRAVVPGYLFRVEPGELDLDSFAELSAAGRRAAQGGQWTKASEDLAAALSLWRGAPLADVSGPQQDVRIQSLLEARLQAFEGRIEADLELGRHAELVDELRGLIADQPRHEAFHGQLMLALYRTDRRDEALEAFESLRRTLVDELGVEPSPSLQQLHRRILDGDPGLALAAGSTNPAGPASPNRVGPRFQLPADTRAFTGRADELEELIELARAAPKGTDSGMVVISAIDGMGGVGKTALAVHAAHRVREQFPNGQLFLDLRGYTTDLEPLTTGDALDWFLRSLGVPPQMIPQDLGERAAYYRDRLDGTRTLIILDNASSAAQVRPLLPGTPGCLVLVTSRKRLSGLDDASFLALDVLPEADAIALLHTVAGPDRIPAHNPAVLELVTLCGYVPLAIRITASRLRHHPALRIEDVVAQLRDETARLDQFQDEDRNLIAVFDLSYQDLPVPEQHLFRLLGLVPGTDFDVHAAAGLAGLDQRTAEYLLESLLDHNLLTQHTTGRYRFHDLIRVYARSLAEHDPVEDRDAALDRLLDYYLQTAHRAHRHLARHTTSVATSISETSTSISATAPELSDWADALAWMRAERDNLLACSSYAAAHDQSARVVGLIAVLAPLLHQDGPWAQAAALHQTAATTAHDHGDGLGEANALWELGRMRQVTGDYPASTGLQERVLALGRELGHRLTEANALHELGRVRMSTGDYPGAADLVEQALGWFRELGDRLGEGNALWDLGRIRLLTSEYPAAGELHEQALAIYQELDFLPGAANAYWELGRVRLATGRYPAGAELLERALALFRDLGARLGQGNAMSELAAVRLATGNFEAAGELQEQALEIYLDLGHRLNGSYALWNLGRVRLATGHYEAAADMLERALVIFQGLGSRFGESCVMHDLGRVRLATGDYPAAADLLDRCLVIVQDLGDPQSEAVVLNSKAELLFKTTGPDEALPLYRQVLKLATEVNSPLDQGHAFEGIARCLERTGDREAALAELREAVAIFEQLGAAELKVAASYLAELESEGHREPE